MKIKQAIALGLCLFSLTACNPIWTKGVTNTDKGKTESGSITTGRVDNSVYQAIIARRSISNWCNETWQV